MNQYRVTGQGGFQVGLDLVDGDHTVFFPVRKSFKTVDQVPGEYAASAAPIRVLVR